VQGRDKSRQRWGNDAAFGQQELARAAIQKRQCADAGLGFSLVAGGTAYHLVAMLDAGDPDTAVGPLQLQHLEGGPGPNRFVPDIDLGAATGAGFRPMVLSPLRLERLMAPFAFGARLLSRLAARLVLGRFPALPG